MGRAADSPLDALVAFAVPYAQRFLCTKHPVRYAALPHVPALLRALRCRAVSRLAMAWHLGDVKTAPVCGSPSLCPMCVCGFHCAWLFPVRTSASHSTS